MSTNDSYQTHTATAAQTLVEAGVRTEAAPTISRSAYEGRKRLFIEIEIVVGVEVEMLHHLLQTATGTTTDPQQKTTLNENRHDHADDQGQDPDPDRTHTLRNHAAQTSEERPHHQPPSIATGTKDDASTRKKRETEPKRPLLALRPCESFSPLFLSIFFFFFLGHRVRLAVHWCYQLDVISGLVRAELFHATRWSL